MKICAMLLLLGLAAAVPASAAEPMSRTFPAPADRVWAATEVALKAAGWSVDHADRPSGTIVTQSQRVEGDNNGIQATTRRVRLYLRVRPAGRDGTAVQVEREQFVRERVLWVERDQPLPASSIDAIVPADRSLERQVLAAIARAL
jgi:hypothetical protein